MCTGECQSLEAISFLTLWLTKGERGGNVINRKVTLGVGIFWGWVAISMENLNVTQGNAQKRLILPMEWRSSRPSSSFLAAQRYKSAT